MAAVSKKFRWRAARIRTHQEGCYEEGNVIGGDDTIHRHAGIEIGGPEELLAAQQYWLQDYERSCGGAWDRRFVGQ